MEETASGLERRTRQFEHYLGLMQHRTFNLVGSDCFLVFEAPMPSELQMRLGGESRLVQFAFMEDSFYLDLPDTTLTPEEAKALVTRPGFYYALAESQKRLGERQFDPVQRRYSYSQLRIAAEDTSYIFFSLWKVPLDEYLEVTAASFESDCRWEQDFSMG
jgi:hypothetical protein